MPGRAVALYMAHFLDNAVIAAFRELKRQIGSCFAVRVLYDNSRSDFDASAFAGSEDFFLYSAAELAGVYPLLESKGEPSLVPGNCMFPIMLFARSHPQFDYVWRIEYDVRFTGRWAELFEFFDGNHTDLLGTTLCRFDERPSWVWWKSLRSPVAELRRAQWLRGYFPLCRLSCRALKTLEEAFASGWRGHEEVVVPTALSFHGRTIEDIGGSGEFVRPGNENRFYTNTPSSQGLTPGTFVSGLAEPHELRMAGKLYHPVKGGAADDRSALPPTPPPTAIGSR